MFFIKILKSSRSPNIQPLDHRLVECVPHGLVSRFDAADDPDATSLASPLECRRVPNHADVAKWLRQCPRVHVLIRWQICIDGREQHVDCESAQRDARHATLNEIRDPLLKGRRRRRLLGL